MIVALARKLIIALWRFVTTGDPLEGVVLGSLARVPGLGSPTRLPARVPLFQAEPAARAAMRAATKWHLTLRSVLRWRSRGQAWADGLILGLDPTGCKYHFSSSNSGFAVIKWSQVPVWGILVRTVTVRLRAAEFSAVMSEMRESLDRTRYEPTKFKYDQESDAVVLSVEFLDDHQGEAFARRFGLTEWPPFSLAGV
jgi:hypothetical protein